MDWHINWQSASVNKQHQLFVSETNGSIIWYVQFGKSGDASDTAAILVTGAGTAASGTLTMPVNTDQHMQLIATHNHCELRQNGAVVLTADLINGNTNAFGLVILEVYGASTDAQVIQISNMTIAPRLAAMASAPPYLILQMI